MDLPDGDAVVAGLVADEVAAASLITALCASGIELSAIRIGAHDSERAQAIAAANGVGAGVAPDDPLAGAPGLANAVDQRRAVDRGGMIGALVGAVAGAAFGLFPLGHFIAVDPGWAPLADGLLLFVVGGVSGAVLGGAFGPRLSTHAGFRLIDGMEEGSIGIAVACLRSQTSQTRAVFETAGAADVIVIS
jgi:MFS family permease